MNALEGTLRLEAELVRCRSQRRPSPAPHDTHAGPSLEAEDKEQLSPVEVALDDVKDADLGLPSREKRLDDVPADEAAAADDKAKAERGQFGARKKEEEGR